MAGLLDCGSRRADLLGWLSLITSPPDASIKDALEPVKLVECICKGGRDESEPLTGRACLRLG